MSLEERNEILISKADITSCLLNCSNHGICNLTYQKCECNSGFKGVNCELAIDPCLSYPCFNHGICLNSTSLISEINTRNYTCNCSNLFYGKNCEWKINVCENEACNKHGYCIDNSSISSCICFQGYSGEKCEITSQELMKAKTVRKSSVIIAILCVVLFLSYIFFMDCTSSKRKNIGTRSEQLNKSKDKSEKIHFYYTP